MSGVDWKPLDEELARLEGAPLTLWWRDDDAVEPTPELDRLLTLAARFEAPIAIATIPEATTTELAERLAAAPGAVALPHGWRHQSHAPASEKKAELGAHRPTETVLAEIDAGWRRVRSIFGDLARPALTPPWNRIAPALFPSLPGLGLSALSTFGPRPGPEAAPGLAWLNTHIDPIEWRGARSVVPAERLVPQIAGLLADRRSGRADASEPLGLLTHHLVHDEAIWSFCEALLERLAARATLRFAAP